MKVFILGLGASKEELKDSVSIAELMVYEKDTEISLLLSGYLLKAYETASDPDTKKLYAIIASEYYAERHFEPFKRFAAMYPMNPITEIYVKDLLNNNKEIVEQQYFYDDDDGEMNYGQLMSGAGDYKVEDRGTYVKLSRTNAAGIKLSIYANKPDKSEGIDDIHNEFAERHLRSIIVVHRGHSFHAQETIDQIPDIARIVMLGSCGGFGMILQVKEKAPKASIVSTKGTGTITVNAPLLANIHNALLDSSILVWRDVWQKTEKSIMNLDDFAYYVRPDKNIGSNIIGTYNASK